MPTTNDEAHAILAIATEYLPVDRQEELFTRLDREVGSHTTNDSLKVTLGMLAQFVSYTATNMRSDQAHVARTRDRWLLRLVVALHTFVVCGNILAFLALPFKAAWWVALPLCSLIFFITLNRKLECPLTAVENRLRGRLGLRRINGFVGHYFVKPWRRL